MRFLPSEDIVLHALNAGSWTQKLDQTLATLKPAVVKKVLGLKLAGSVGLCAVDGSGNVLRKGRCGGSRYWRRRLESKLRRGRLGRWWLRREAWEVRGGFAVLGVKKENKKAKEKVTEEAVEDWEKEVEGWEVMFELMREEGGKSRGDCLAGSRCMIQDEQSRKDKRFRSPFLLHRL